MACTHVLDAFARSPVCVRARACRRDPVFDFAWLQSKTGSEAMSVSSDGQVRTAQRALLCAAAAALHAAGSGLTQLACMIPLDLQ